MDVAEFVPQVTFLQGGSVRPFEEGPTGHGLEHGQVGGFWLVPSRQQAVDRTHDPIGCDHGFGPSAPGTDMAAAVDDRFERTYHGGSDCHHRASLTAGVIDAMRRSGRDPVVLGVRRLGGLE